MKKKIIIAVVIIAVIALIGTYIGLRVPRETVENLTLTTATGEDSIVITVETTDYRSWLLTPHWNRVVSWGKYDMLRYSDQFEFSDEYASIQYTNYGRYYSYNPNNQKIVEQTILKLFELDGKKICALYVVVSDRAESGLLFIGPSESAEESQALFELIDETYGDVDYYGTVYLTD